MTARRQNEKPAQPERRARRDYRPSPRFALQVSLGVHALFVLALFRMVTEYASQPEPPLHIVAQAAAPRSAATPSFVTRPLSVTDDPEKISRPAARVQSLPHQTTSFAESSIAPIRPAAPGSRRATTPAVLPSTIVPVPAEDGVPLETGVASVTSSPDHATLERADTLRDLPLRIASRPIYGAREQRPIGLAMLPTARSVGQQRQTAEAFAQRYTNAQTPRESRAAIDRGLEFLVRMQLDDGRWRFDDLRGSVDPDVESVSIRADAAATGLALLALLGAGYDHCDGRYRASIDDALEFLIRTQQSTGELYVDSGLPSGQVTRFYGHGIATLALAEAYGMTGDSRLRRPAERAIAYLAATQHPLMGGWRYAPGVNTDLSVTGWQLVALRSGQLAGLKVPSETLARIDDCLATCRDNESHPGLYRYNPWASPTDPLTRHGRSPSTVMTSVGLLMELHLGAAPNDERLRLAAAHLLANLPRTGDSPLAAPVGTLGNPDRDTYYWYYGTQAMFYLGGDDWRAWSSQLEPLLVASQSKNGPLAGSWDPLHPVPDKWSAYGGRLYVTAMNLLSLEIHNRHLPLESEAAPQIAERPE